MVDLRGKLETFPAALFLAHIASPSLPLFQFDVRKGDKCSTSCMYTEGQLLHDFFVNKPLASA